MRQDQIYADMSGLPCLSDGVGGIDGDGNPTTNRAVTGRTFLSLSGHGAAK